MNTGFVPMLGAFYCVFHPTQGSKVMCQVPDGCVIPTETSEVEQFIVFDEVKNYLIPKPALCNKLVRLRVGKYEIMGYPINLVGPEYERNSFTFNFACVFPNHGNAYCYETALVRFCKMARIMEEQTHFLSNPENIHEIDNVLEQVYQDMNSFSECQIPMGEDIKVNMKLFPISESPPVVRRYHVPIPTVRLNSLMDEHWDPTMERIVPYLNGINSVRQIADLAEADYDLTKQCISHLIHYDCVVIIGIFQFSNIYTPTPEIGTVATDPQVYHELLAFVYHPSQGHSDNGQSGSSFGSTTQFSNTPASHNSSFENFMYPYTRLTPRQMFDLYASLGTGQSVYTWYQEHANILQDLDVRRFIIFGVIKRIIMRAHAFPIYDRASSHNREREREPSDADIVSALQAVQLPHDEKIVQLIRKSLRTPTRIDDLCSGLRASRIKVSKLLKGLGEWSIINR